MILLQIYFDIPTEKERDFENMYAESITVNLTLGCISP